MLELIRYVDDCVVSLTEERDLLSQWRGYAPAHGGYSIGFETELLLAQTAEPDFIFSRCEYEPDEQRKLLGRVIEGNIEFFDRAVEKGDKAKVESEAERMTPRLFAGIARVAPLIKHASFKEENEWRIIRGPVFVDALARKSDPILFRTSNASLIPYNQFRLAPEDEPLKIQSIIIGPTQEPELSRNALEKFLRANGLRDVQIGVSDTPYRGW